MMMNTHMPFLTYSLEGERVLLFCQTDDLHHWKIFISINGAEPVRLETGLSDNMVECSPAAWHDETGWHLSFIAGGASDNPLYHLYRMDGQTLTSLSRPVAIRPAKTGFIYLDRLVVGELQDVVHVHDPEGDHTIELPGAFLYRVSYRADQTDTLLITGQWINETEVFSIEYDLATGEQRLIECDGQPAYKPTIYGDEVLYAERIGEHFEQRQLRTASQSQIKPCRIAFRRPDDDMAVHRNRTGRCRCSDPRHKASDLTRPSCIECVEKHLGAAMVMLAEINVGYAYRLQFVGHLHEAEDESQQWQQLHDLIRQARKAWQQQGTVPDWELLAQTLAEAKNDAR
jgi:hypothetical protein